MPSIVSRIVEVFVFRFRDVQPEYLLLKRSRSDSLYPGIWQVVTGTLHEGEPAVHGALRELQEETSLKPVRMWTVPHVVLFYDRVADAMNVNPLFAVQVPPSAEPVLSSEHEEFVWLPADAAARLLVWPGQREGLYVVERSIAGGERAMGLSEIPLPPS